MGFGLLVQAAPAAADIPPEGSCSPGELGQPCDNAVDESGNDVGAGVCVADTCRRATPDGPMTYDCVMCRKPTQPNAGGAGNEPVEPSAGNAGDASAGQPATSAGNAGTSGAGTAGAPGGDKGGSSATAGASSQPTKKPDSDDGGGCSLSSGARRAGGLAGLISVAVVGLALSRRRSRRRAR
ncbi:MAG: hypothetical protein ABUL60_00780 [Myxococcales bacterium]